MDLQTQLPVVKAPNPISYQSKVLLLGSCFATHIAAKLAYYKFRSTVNPFGIIYHPQAISNLISRASEEKEFRREELFCHQELWHCFDVHSEMSKSDPDVLLSGLNSELKNLKELLHNATHLVITLGTAWGYTRKDNGMRVANCYKVARKEFNKVLSSPSNIQKDLIAIRAALYKINPEISIILTVSPVRHLKDGFVENQRSKAHLLCAVHELIDEFSSQAPFYFPSYELMMDELRDYRFYEADMVHPNSLAVDYIWEKFTSGCIDQKALTTMRSVEEIQKGLDHRPFNPDARAYKDFRVGLKAKIEALSLEYPFMDFG
ncbi:GSCFA domain-containing protein [Muriicola soli]|uniref:GSCFA domain-containing protein n=1 Tax=Muriicola soli TaxID=2507538 RepID=A0A411EB39_9FLAO|nr:GSCFA domain-containing protein [Muriicola soli]QBA64945.1 GSCFA domain-containing protein [Muriicola soli]